MVREWETEREATVSWYGRIGDEEGVMNVLRTFSITSSVTQIYEQD